MILIYRNKKNRFKKMKKKMKYYSINFVYKLKQYDLIYYFKYIIIKNIASKMYNKNNIVFKLIIAKLIVLQISLYTFVLFI